MMNLVEDKEVIYKRRVNNSFQSFYVSPLFVKMTTISLSRKQNLLLKPNSQEIDFSRVNAHLGRLRTKYQGNLATFKATSGQQHPWYKSTSNTKPTFLNRILSSLRGGKKGGSTGNKQNGSNSSANGGTGNVPLTDESEELWHGPITLGGQTIQVDFDTGSSDVSKQEL